MLTTCQSCQLHQSPVSSIVWLTCQSGIGYVLHITITWSHQSHFGHVPVMNCLSPITNVLVPCQSCQSRVSHVLVTCQSRPCHGSVTCHMCCSLAHVSFMTQSHISHVLDAFQSYKLWQSCQTWSHVSLVRSITCQSCQSRVTHVGHVSHWLSIGHISLMCWSHATGVNRVTSPNCWSCFSHVSITCQLCLWHVNHAIASRWSRLCQSRDGVIMCWSCVSHVGHVPITYGHVPVVSHESIMCQWSTGLASDTCQTRSCVDCQSCESPVTCWSCQCVSHVSYLIMWWSLVDSWSLKCHVGHVWIMCQLCHSCVTMHRASHVNHVSYQ